MLAKKGSEVNGADLLSLHHHKQLQTSRCLPPHLHQESMKKEGADGSLWSRSESRIWTLMLLLGTCLLYCTRVSMPICIVAMSTHFGWDKKQSGIALSSFFWGYCLTQIVGGHLSDGIGGEKVILLSASAWGSISAVTPLLIYFSSAPLTLTACSRFLMGLSQGVYFPSLTSLLSRKVRESERSFAYSTVGTGSYFGTLVMGAAGSLLLDGCGWESVFYFPGMLTLIWVYCMHKYLLNDKEITIPLEDLARGFSLPKETKVPWKQIFKKPPVWAVITAQLCVASTFFTLLSWLPTFFSETFPDSKGWIFNVIPWLVAIPSSLLSGFLSDQFISHGYKVITVRKLMQVMGTGVSSIFALGMAHTSNFYQAIIFASACIGLQTFNHRCCLCVLSRTPDRKHRFLGVCFQLCGSSECLRTLHISDLRKSPKSGHSLCLCRPVTSWTRLGKELFMLNCKDAEFHSKH
uniref:Solute carrier family 17 member 9 n=1 Tax=Salvator merianae TaxID=96440 RepID=A0A8D0CA48_SALMN